ncbi:MAG: hypothetical protein AB1656_25295 [Candidatus Omnitrophota bacterium]
MKSAAFNLAFKVHRNEIPFAEGLLKSVESGAQEDFIVALNSLAGETKYNINKLEQLIDEARRGLTDKPKEKKVDLSAMEEELKQFRSKRDEYKENIQTYQTQIATLAPTILPGVNSFLLFLVGIVFVILFVLLGFGLIAVIVLLATLLAAAYFLFQDLSLQKKQKEEVQRKKERYAAEIEKITAVVNDLEAKIAEKEKIMEQIKASSPPTEEDANPLMPSLD